MFPGPLSGSRQRSVPFRRTHGSVPYPVGRNIAELFAPRSRLFTIRWVNSPQLLAPFDKEGWIVKEYKGTQTFKPPPWCREKAWPKHVPPMSYLDEDIIKEMRFTRCLPSQAHHSLIESLAPDRVFAD